MDRIKIYSHSGAAVTLPRCRPIISYADESISTKMASGKMVEDIIGRRLTISAKYGYVPAQDIALLNAIANEGGFHRCQAPGIEGDIDAYFKVASPSYEVFRYIGRMPMWINVSLTLTSQEVIR